MSFENSQVCNYHVLYFLSSSPPSPLSVSSLSLCLDSLFLLSLAPIPLFTLWSPFPSFCFLPLSLSLSSFSSFSASLSPKFGCSDVMYCPIASMRLLSTIWFLPVSVYDILKNKCASMVREYVCLADPKKLNKLLKSCALQGGTSLRTGKGWIKMDDVYHTHFW